MRIPLIAGNWKMFKTKAEALVFAEEFKKLYQGTDVQAAVCAPFTDLEALVEALQGYTCNGGRPERAFCR